MSKNSIKVFVVGGDIGYANLFIDKVKLVPKVDSADIVLFTGGEDVHPGLYNEKKGRYTNYNEARDVNERDIFYKAQDQGKFMLGVCRGSQILTIMSGGSLVQHVTKHAINGTHPITLINENVDIEITSTHHQMMYPFNLDKSKYRIIAKSAENLSEKYLNGSNLNMMLSNNFVEPEIVYYNNTKCLCIQGHPEYMPKDSSAVKYINVLIREFLEEQEESQQNAYDAPIPQLNRVQHIDMENEPVQLLNTTDRIRAFLDANAEVRAVNNHDIIRQILQEDADEQDINW